jgi:hypothetical protein
MPISDKPTHEAARGRSPRTPLWIVSGVALVVWGVAGLITCVALLIWYLA